MAQYKTGIVLSGGGARGFAHLGVLKALFEKDIQPEIISGVSAGAIAGTFIADGKDPEEAHRILKDKGFLNFSKINFPGRGLLKLEGLGEILDQQISVTDLKDLKIPLFVTLANMLDGVAEYYKEGPLSTLVMASSSIPVLFEPVNYKNKLYSDGGLFENIPVTPIEKLCDNIIGVNINPVPKIETIKSLGQMAKRTFHLNVDATAEKSKEKCDIFIEPPELSKYDILETKNADALFNIGYEYTRNMEIEISDKK